MDTVYVEDPREELISGKFGDHNLVTSKDSQQHSSGKNAVAISASCAVSYDSASNLHLLACLENGHNTKPITTVNRFIPNFKDWDKIKKNLSIGGTKVFNDPNAGGNSIVSECLSYEVMSMMYGAKDVHSEMEVHYMCEWKICDYTVEIFGHRVGVSVTRAMHFLGEESFTPESAVHLMQKKLYGLIMARNNACDRDTFFNCILHVWCQSERIAKLLCDAHKKLSGEYTDNVLVCCTVAENCQYIFKNLS